MVWSNYHTHSNFCDGTGSIEEYIQHALKNNVSRLGISSHCPAPFYTNWAMDILDLDKYCSEIITLKEKYNKQLKINLGMEIDYIPELIQPTDDLFSNLNLEYCIGSVHYVGNFEDGTPCLLCGDQEEFQAGLIKIFKNDIVLAVTEYYRLIREMITNSAIDIVGHLDLIKKHNHNNYYFSPDEPWYQKSILHTLDIIAGSNCILEVNTGGISRGIIQDIYPSLWVLKIAYEMGIRVTLASDAHNPKHVAFCFKEALTLIKKAGYKEIEILSNGIWIPEAISKIEKKLAQIC